MNQKKILVLDTSVLCVWLKVPNMDTCGSDADRWDYKRIEDHIKSRIENGATLMLPLATIIETGNHIAQARGDRYAAVNHLCDIIEKVADGKSPWAVFSRQSELWTEEKLKSLAQRWRESGITGQSIGDASIVEVVELYRKLYRVEILTGDEGLKAYEPFAPVVPRRRQ